VIEAPSTCREPNHIGDLAHQLDLVAVVVGVENDPVDEIAQYIEYLVT
jgi:hypothetical protein